MQSPLNVAHLPAPGFCWMLVWLAALAVASPAQAADEAWVGGTIQLNLRTGPGTKYRILEAVETGDRVAILERRAKWTRVQLPGGRSGWVPVGYLEATPPALLERDRLRDEVATLETERDTAEREVQTLRQRSDNAAATLERQGREIETLTRANLRYEAGERWPEWLTGAGILATGGLVGALLKAVLSRRRRSGRLRL
jgi:SH3 domain protein